MMAILELRRCTHRLMAPACLTAVVLFTITSHRPAFAQEPGCVNQGYRPTATTVSNCQNDDDGMWDRFTNYCGDVGCKFRDWRRKLYWWHNSSHKHLMYEDIPPYHSANYGYFQTCWRPMPEDCERCPEINYTRHGSALQTQMPQQQMTQPPMVPPSMPATSGPAGDPPPPPSSSPQPPSSYFPPSEDTKPEPIPPPPAQAPPEELGWRPSAQPLNQHFKLLPPQGEIVTTQEELVAPLEELVVVSSDDQRVSRPNPFFPILPVDVVLPNDGWEPYEERVPGIIIRARGVYE